MDGGHRRAFLSGCTAAGISALVADRLAAAAPVQNRRPAAGSAAPALAIAHYRTPADGAWGWDRRGGEAPDSQAVLALAAWGASSPAATWSGQAQHRLGPRPEQAANTNPDVVAAVVRFVSRRRKRVMVSDNATIPAQRAFPRSGIQAAAQKAGAEADYLDSRRFRRMAIRASASRNGRSTPRSSRPTSSSTSRSSSITAFAATLGMKNLMGVIGGRAHGHQDLPNSLSTCTPS